MFDFTAVNVETTNNTRKNVCSICLIEYKNKTEVDRRHWMVKPDNYKFDKVAHYRHGIKEDDLLDKPDLYDVWGEIVPYLDGKTLIAFPGNYTVECLIDSYNTRRLIREKELRNNTLPVFEYICIHLLMHQLFADINEPHIEGMCKNIGVKIDIFNEYSKTQALSDLLNHSINRFGFNNFHELKKRADITIGERTNFLIHYYKNTVEIENLRQIMYCIPKHDRNPIKKASLHE